MKQRLQRCFDRARGTYEANAAPQRKIARQCLKLIPRQDYLTVLEIGSGSGLLTLPACDRLRPKDYLVCDLSRSMLQSLAGQLGLLAFQADGEDMPLAPKSVDLLLSASAMQWYARPLDSALKNLGLLRPGGDFVLALFVRGTLLELVKSSQASGFGSFYPLARVKGYLQGLQKIPWLSWHFQVRNYIQWHDSVLAFLHQHKQTGANLSPGGTDRAGKTKLKRFCAYYRSCFQRQGLVPATYRVLYLYGQRKD